MPQKTSLFKCLLMPVTASMVLLCATTAPAEGKVTLFAAPEDMPEIEPLSSQMRAETVFADTDKNFFDKWIARRLEIGVRYMTPTLDEESRWDEEEGSGFLGTIAYLNETDAALNNFVLFYKICEWFGLGATWDSVVAIATTETADKHSDGEWYASGPTLSAVLTTPRLLDIFSPYIEIGVHFPDASFDAYTWWGQGYPSPEIWRELGSPKNSRKGYRRVISAQETDSATLAYGMGLKIYLAENLAFDIAYRHINVDETAHYHLEISGRTISDRGFYDIPLSYSELCLGLRWAF